MAAHGAKQSDWLSSIIERWFQKTSNGRDFVPLPWEVNEFSRGQAVPFYTRERLINPALLVGMSLGFFLFGWAFHAKVLAGLGAGILTCLLMAWQKVWTQSGRLHVNSQPIRKKYHERDFAEIAVPVLNAAKTQSEPALLQVVFEGSTLPEQYLEVPKLQPGERRTILARFRLDRGMGEFRVTSCRLAVRDALGLFKRAVAVNLDVTIEVVPEDSTLPPLAIHVAGSTMHSGVFEAKSSGDSPTFLGLRPFRSGDSIRRIDWKRSQRHQELVVREFEKLNSTDATILIDSRLIGVFEFAALNSLELVRDTTIALVRGLLDRQIRVRLCTESVVTEMSKGRMHFELILEIIKNLLPQAQMPFEDLVRRTLENVPPDSVFIPIFFDVGNDLKSLFQTFQLAEHNRVEVIPVMVDTESFERRIVHDANLTKEQRDALAFMKSQFLNVPFIEAIPDHIREKMLVLRAGKI